MLFSKPITWNETKIGDHVVHIVNNVDYTANETAAAMFSDPSWVKHKYNDCVFIDVGGNEYSTDDIIRLFRIYLMS